MQVQADDTFGGQFQLIAEARRAVLAQTEKNVFDPTPYQGATELLESLPPVKFVDARVQLALDITAATRTDYRPDLTRRALYAAFPAGSDLHDNRLRRKWFSFTAIVEAALGNVEQALKYKLIALELCEQLNDSLGFYIEWTNFANLATGAGLYQDAVEYASVAIKAEMDAVVDWVAIRRTAFLCRANALIRLGRFTEARSDLCSCLMSVTHPPSASLTSHIVPAQCLFAELQLECGDLSDARSALCAASTWATASGLPQYKLQIERVGTRLSVFDGGLEPADEKLQKLLEEAQSLEARLGETSFEDVVLEILHTLERVHRAHGTKEGADKWLRAISKKLRSNAIKLVDALADKAPLANGTNIAAKMAEIDRYLQCRSMTRAGTLSSDSPWTYLIGLAASATGTEDPTKEHGVRVARLASLVARELGLSDTVREEIEAGCVIHDVGKVSIPTSILLKSTPLDANELHLYDAHADVGAELLERLTHPEQSIVRNIVRFHHHSYVGGASQSTPVGHEIPLEARIASVCDEYDALVTGRPRRPAISTNDALREIFEHRSRKFDPKVVDVFVEIVRRLQQTYADLQAYLSEEADSMEYFATQRTLKRAAGRALATDERQLC